MKFNGADIGYISAAGKGKIQSKFTMYTNQIQCPETIGVT